MSQTQVPEYYDHVANVAVLLERLRVHVDSEFIGKPPQLSRLEELAMAERALENVAQILGLAPQPKEKL